MIKDFEERMKEDNPINHVSYTQGTEGQIPVFYCLPTNKLELQNV